MNSISAQEAFLAYEAVRHRLPNPVPSDKQPRDAENLDEIAEEFDAFLLDAFGVLNIGDVAIPGTRERIARLRTAGKRVLVVSNAAGLPHEALVRKYAGLGYEFGSEDVITSRATLLAGLNGRHGLHWGLMATRSSGLGELGDLNLTYLEDDPAPYSEVDGFLMIGSAAWTEARQSLLEAALLEQPRPVLVGNPDIVAPRETGFSTEPGYFAHRLADRTGVAPEFFGKPFANIFEIALERLGPVEKSRILMVGDSLHTDILGAQSAGVASALVSGHGFFAGQNIEAVISRTGITPNFVVTDP